MVHMANSTKSSLIGIVVGNVFENVSLCRSSLCVFLQRLSASELNEGQRYNRSVMPSDVHVLQYTSQHNNNQSAYHFLTARKILLLYSKKFENIWNENMVGKSHLSFTNNTLIKTQASIRYDFLMKLLPWIDMIYFWNVYVKVCWFFIEL